MPSPPLRPTRDAPSLSAAPSSSSSDEESSPKLKSAKRKADQVDGLDGSERPKKRVPAQTWEEMRPFFTRLYQEERRPLKECMAIMESEYKFVATVKMYKSRVWKWGLDKKLKGDEVLAMLVLLDQRKKMNKTRTGFMIRKQPVDMDNVKRYLKRNPALMARYQAGNMPSVRTSHEVECYTPGSSPRLAPAVLPFPGDGDAGYGGNNDSFSIYRGPSYSAAEPYKAEKLLWLVRDYVDMAFSTGKWRCQYDKWCKTSVANDRSEDLFGRVIASFALVNRYLGYGDQISINAMLDPVFESLKELVATESPIFLVRMVCLLWYLDRSHKHDMQRIVFDYLRGLIPIVLRDSPVMLSIWQVLGSTDFSDYFELAMRMYDVLVPALTARIGPANYLLYILYTDHTDSLLKNRPEDALAVATRYRHLAESTGLRHPWLVELAITQTAAQSKVHEDQGNVTEALRVFSSLFTYNMRADQEAGINVQVAYYHFKLGDMETATSHYRQAIRLTAQSLQPDEQLLMTSLSNLERALRKMGRADESKRVSMYRLERLQRFARESNAMSVASPCVPCGPDGVPEWIWRERSRSPSSSNMMSSRSSITIDTNINNIDTNINTTMNTNNSTTMAMFEPDHNALRTARDDVSCIPRHALPVSVPPAPGPWQTLAWSGPAQMRPPPLAYDHSPPPHVAGPEYPSPEMQSLSAGHSPANYLPSSQWGMGGSPMEARRGLLVDTGRGMLAGTGRGVLMDARRVQAHGRYLDVPTSVGR